MVLPAVVIALPVPLPRTTPSLTPVCAPTSEGSQQESTGPLLGLAACAPLIPSSSLSPSSSHACSTHKLTRGRAHTFAGHSSVARLRSALRSIAAVNMASSGGGAEAPHPLLSLWVSGASAVSSYVWCVTTGGHDSSERQQKQSSAGVAGTVAVVDDTRGDEGPDGVDEESNYKDATWRRGHANMVQLPPRR